MKREERFVSLLPPGPFPRPVPCLAASAGGKAAALSSRRQPAPSLQQLRRRLMGWHRQASGVVRPAAAPGASAKGSRKRSGPRPNGFQVLELIKVVSAIGIVGVLALPPALRGLGQLRLRWAAEQVAGVLRGARRLAAERGVGVGIRFGTGAAGGLTYALYADGTGNGVREGDVETGADPQIMAPRPLPLVGRGVRIGFPPGRRVRDPSSPGRYLGPGERPIEFAGSALARFDPLGGGATPGTLFLTDGEGLAVVRVAGGTGASSILMYDLRSERWH